MKIIMPIILLKNDELDLLNNNENLSDLNNNTSTANSPQ